MGVFDNNISKPLSITTIGKDIKEWCMYYLKEKARLYINMDMVYHRVPTAKRISEELFKQIFNRDLKIQE